MDISYSNIKSTRKIILFNMVSLHSRFEWPNDEIDCLNVDDKFNRFAAEEFETVDTLLFGRKTYQLM